MTQRLVFRNSAWLIADKVVRLGLGLVVWMWLARAVGPEAFGQWSFAVAFAALFGVVAGLGLDGVLQRELIAKGTDAPALLGTAALLRMGVGGLACAACVGAAMLMRPGQGTFVGLVALNALVFVLQSSQVIDYMLQSRMKNRPAVVAMNAAFLVATSVRIALLLADAPLLWFGGTLVLEAALSAILLLAAARSDGFAVTRWRFDAVVARRLLSESWPMLLAGMAVMMYMRIDQLMLATMTDDGEVGQFSAALRLSEVWYFIPAAIMTAMFPAMMNVRNEGAAAYEAFLQRLYDGMLWMAIIVAVVVGFAAPHLVVLLYGPLYAEAAPVLQVQIWAGTAVGMSYVHGKWLLAEGLQRLGLLYTLVGCIVNLGLNLVLIPRYGALGAAWATLATQIGVLPIQLVFPRGRRNFGLMMRALWAPLRWVRHYHP
jgi:polysaccharide transporter, PST family